MDYGTNNNTFSNRIIQTARAFTGHEQIAELSGLIHMNARVYDSDIGRFLSADTIIQAPHDSQSYNRYSYVRNNPLVFTDPSGHSWLSKLWHHIKHAIRTIAAIVVAAVIAIYAPEFLGAYIHSAFGVTVATGALAGFASGGIMTGSLGGALKGALFGAISAGVAYGVAEVAGKLSGLGSLEGHTATLLKSGLNKLTAIKTMLHGLSRGIISKLQGGSFKAGFMSGLSSAFDIGTKAFGIGAGGFSMRTAVMAIVGGTASALGGGKFANGAVSGAFVHMFNAEGGTLTKALKSLAKGFYNIGDYAGRVTGFRDWQNGSVVLKDYYRNQAMTETQAVSTLAKNALLHPEITGKAISIYNQFNQEQVNANTVVNASVGLVVPAAGIVSLVGNTMSAAHQINEIYIGLRN